MKELGLQNIAIGEIDVTNRLRTVDEGYAALLAENITQAGRLRQPIEVRKARRGSPVAGYVLIAGGHRLRAAQILGWTEIPAFVYDATDDEARLAEIDENLVRHELCPLDRAVFMAEREAVYLRLNPPAGHGGDRKSDAYKDQVATVATRSFAKDTADRVGMSDRTIRLALWIHEKLKLDVRARIAGTWLAKRQVELVALAKLERGEQHAVLDLLFAVPDPAAKSVAEATAMVRDVRASPLSETEAQFQRLLKVWGRTKGPARKQFLDHLDGAGDLNWYKRRAVVDAVHSPQPLSREGRGAQAAANPADQTDAQVVAALIELGHACEPAEAGEVA